VTRGNNIVKPQNQLAVLFLLYTDMDETAQIERLNSKIGKKKFNIPVLIGGIVFAVLIIYLLIGSGEKAPDPIEAKVAELEAKYNNALQVIESQQMALQSGAVEEKPITDEVELYRLQMELSARKEQLVKELNLSDSVAFYYGKYEEVVNTGVMSEIKAIDEKIGQYRTMRETVEKSKYSYKYASESLGL